MKPPIIAAIMAVINSTDVTDSGIYYRGRISQFQMSSKSSLYAEARRENPDLRPSIMGYCACRWHYPSLRRALDCDSTREVKRTLYNDYVVEIRNERTGKTVTVRPVDWGPARWTGRIIDVDAISMTSLKAKTDDVVVIRLKKR